MALDYQDERVEVTSYDGTWFSTHYYAKVDGVELHRVLSEGDTARLNRGRNSSDYRPGDSYQGFDSTEDALAAARAVLDDTDRTGLDPEWPRHLVRRVDGRWVPTSADAWLDLS